jgi:chorismate mutase/prephenate dehydratase
VFFIDLEGHAEDASLKSALTELQKNSSLFRIVGAYPKAVK